MAKRKKRKPTLLTIRNHVALAAIFQPGIKRFPDRKHAANKAKCRKRIVV